MKARRFVVWLTDHTGVDPRHVQDVTAEDAARQVGERFCTADSPERRVTVAGLDAGFVETFKVTYSLAVKADSSGGAL